MTKTNKLEKLKYIISKMITDEQAEHSLLISNMRQRIGKTKEFEDSIKVLSQVHDHRAKILEEIYSIITKL